MVTEQIINTVVGGLVTIKVLETGTKMMDRPRKKKKGNKHGGLLL
jgi:hypothetical protein